MKKLLYILFALITQSAFSLDFAVKNVIASAHGQNIIISYDITTKNLLQRFDVKVFYSLDNGKTYSQNLEKVRGDAGFNITGGENKKITWNVLSEVSQFNASGVIFKVTADLIDFGYNDMVLIPSGDFTMGSSLGGSDEQPEHEVKIRDFYMSKTEITVAQYRNYCTATGTAMPEKGIVWVDNHPMTFVSWHEAVNYCKWLSNFTGEKYRLPTEAEWEYAAKGGDKSKNYKYSGGNNLNDVGWYQINSGGFGHAEVAKLKENELGLYDMTGNVWEWCNDWYGKTYYLVSSKENPQGPPSGAVKVARGGAWRTPAKSVSNTFRFFMTPTASSNYVGFRIVKETK